MSVNTHITCVTDKLESVINFYIMRINSLPLFMHFQLQAARVRRQEEEAALNGTNGDSSRGSTPTPVPERGNSPPIPALRPSQGENSSNNSEFESASMGLSSDDDQVKTLFNQSTLSYKDVIY